MSEPSTTSMATDKVAFGRYKLLHLLAQGGMGEVYLAKLSGAAGFEKLCVLKTILPNFTEAEDFVQRFHHEAKTLVQLNHSNIAQIYDMGEGDSTYYMALEYVAGVDLSRVLKRSKEKGLPLPVPIALFIGQRVAEALDYAHRKTGPDGKPMAIVHRDMSPHNVLVSYEGEVKVIDFGLAKSAARSLHTMPATVLGKLGYMSPEQARAEEIDHRSDLYSCGVVVWELLACRALVKRGTFAEMLSAMAYPKVPQLTEIRPDVPPEVNDAVLRALAVRPEERYERAGDFAVALNEEFIKLKSHITSEKVGAYIRELCPEEFDQQRKMLSGLSVLAKNEGETARRPSVRPTKMERSSPRPSDPPDQHEDDATSIRKSAPPGAPAAPVTGEVAATVLRPSELRSIKKSRNALLGGISGGVVVLGAVGFLLLRPDKAPVESPKPPPVVQVPVVATPVATPKPPDPAPVAPTPVAPTPTANPAPGPAPEVHAAVAEKRKTLEKRMETLRRQYEALVARVGVDQLQPMATAAYDEARSEFKKNIGNPRTYGDMEQTLKDAESYLSKERRRLGQ